uniref:transposase n=1 Tax=Klebsiella quasipneumoniae TaxID=1463165 RepID=UPI002E7798FC
IRKFFKYISVINRPPQELTADMKKAIRAKVEHPFRIIKRQFGFVKARYKGLLKNDNQLAMLFTLANLFRADQMIRQWERSH